MPHWISIFCFVLVALIKVIVCESFFSEEEIKCPSLNSSEIEASLYDNRVNKSLACGCKKRWCLPLCCQIGSFIKPPEYYTCIPMENKSVPSFPPLHDPLTLEPRSEQLRINDYQLFSWDPCNGSESFNLDPNNPGDAFKLLANGSIHFPAYRQSLPYTIHYFDYCFAAIDDSDYYDDDYQSVYIVKVCFPDNDEDTVAVEHVNTAEDVDSPTSTKYIIGGQFGRIISIPCLCVTFLVYSIVPELRNMHGSTLRAYVGSLVIAYIHLVIAQFVEPDYINPNLCKLLAYVLYLFSLAGFFWLNVMCFDIWWTFRGFRSLRGSIKPQKQFIIYSVYAWGSSFFFTGICLIMELLPYVPSNWTRPGFEKRSCWFQSDAAVSIYFYGPVAVTIVCNICLFVSTAIKLIQHKKATAHQLKGIDSRRHDVNKQRFNLYLTLFVVMGLNWSTDVLSWFLKNDTPSAVWLITDLVNSLQGVIIFAISVWKDKIKRLVLKRLGCRERKLTWANSTRSAYHSSTSRSCTSTAIALTPRLQDNKKLRYSEPMEIIPDETYSLHDSQGQLTR